MTWPYDKPEAPYDKTDWASDPGQGFIPPAMKERLFKGEGADLAPKFSLALLDTLIEETEESVRHLDYELAVHRSRLAWLKAVQRGQVQP